ncbi:hypothetical protein [Methylobacterium oryzisoli]|uniref:hypothetical protein n=1 Tax=Methylobacterium oryzisoli TaxID=3385502 RepID=UPI0038912EA5
MAKLRQAKGGHSLQAVPVKAYQPTPAEEASLASLRARRARKPFARIKATGEGCAWTIAPDHPDGAVGERLLWAALGTACPEFAEGLLKQLAAAMGTREGVSETDLNFALAAMNGVGPRDEVEGMLAAQMTAVHMATMSFASQLANADNTPKRESAERALNKLARTFTTQVEALKRYRSDGQQTVRVERVTVEAGGQAIVGTVSPGPGGGQNGK